MKNDKESQEKIPASLNSSQSPISVLHSKKSSSSGHISGDIKSNKTSFSENTSCSKSSKRSKLENIPHHMKSISEHVLHYSESAKTPSSDHHSESNNTSISEHISDFQTNNTSISEHISQSKPLSCDDPKDEELKELKRSRSNKSIDVESVTASLNSTLLGSTIGALCSISEAVSDHGNYICFFFNWVFFLIYLFVYLEKCVFKVSINIIIINYN